ncbi:MAG: ABC transporter ATP-binding protein [Elainellaceae cyanobacterium]
MTAPSLTPQRRDDNDWQLVKMLLPYAKRHRRLLAIALLLLVPLSVAEAVQPILIGQAVSLIRGEPVAWLLQEFSLAVGLRLLVGLLALTILLRLALSGVQGYQVQKVGQLITQDVRNDLFDHVTALAARFFDRTPVGRLITRLTSDVEALGDVFSTGAIGIVADLFTMIIITVVMFLVQWQLALLLVLVLIPITALMIYFQQQYRRANYKAREELSVLNSSLQENIVGVSIVQLFRRERFNSEAFSDINQRYVAQVDRTIFFDSAVSATLEWVGLAAIGGVLWLGGQLVLGEAIELGTLTTFVLFAQRLFNPLRQFAERFTAVQAGLTALERVNDLVSEPIEIKDPEQAVPAMPRSPVAGEIRFEDVWFGYKPDEYVLRGLDFTIRAGEKIAIVGPTGAGKSSIIRLLCRLYEVSRGRILLDGVDIRDMAQSELRRRMTVILQEGFLFAGDVKANITLGEDYSLDAVKQAAQQTNVADFIEQLPQGYDTPLRQRGTNLSGGEKQLLAFARAAIRNPPILVLDEATANLDVGTEARIQKALEHLLVDRTAIIIAHRLSTIRNVDRIFVMKQGELVESGSHSELLQLGGLYASLHKQMQDNQVGE